MNINKLIEYNEYTTDKFLSFLEEAYEYNESLIDEYDYDDYFIATEGVNEGIISKVFNTIIQIKNNLIKLITNIVNGIKNKFFSPKSKEAFTKIQNNPEARSKKVKVVDVNELLKAQDATNSEIKKVKAKIKSGIITPGEANKELEKIRIKHQKRVRTAKKAGVVITIAAAIGLAFAGSKKLASRKGTNTSMDDINSEADIKKMIPNSVVKTAETSSENNRRESNDSDTSFNRRGSAVASRFDPQTGEIKKNEIGKGLEKEGRRIAKETVDEYLKTINKVASVEGEVAAQTTKDVANACAEASKQAQLLLPGPVYGQDEPAKPSKGEGRGRKNTAVTPDVFYAPDISKSGKNTTRDNLNPKKASKSGKSSSKNKVSSGDNRKKFNSLLNKIGLMTDIDITNEEQVKYAKINAKNTKKDLSNDLDTVNSILSRTHDKSKRKDLKKRKEAIEKYLSVVNIRLKELGSWKFESADDEYTKAVDTILESLYNDIY